MKTRPTLQTARLTLRPFILADAGEVQRLAGADEIASTTLNIPHPYEDGMAEQWIATHPEAFEEGRMVTFAMERRSDGALVGAIGLHDISEHHSRAEMGYWVGLPYWGQGYCTEAARAVLDYAFNTMHLNRVYATHLARNPASGRVMQKIGMHYEGRLRQHVRKGEQFEDRDQYGILRRDFMQGFAGKAEEP